MTRKIRFIDKNELLALIQNYPRPYITMTLFRYWLSTYGKDTELTDDSEKEEENENEENE